MEYHIKYDDVIALSTLSVISQTNDNCPKIQVNIMIVQEEIHAHTEEKEKVFILMQIIGHIQF